MQCIENVGMTMTHNSIISTYIHFDHPFAVAYSEGFRCQYTGLGTQTMCPNQRKTEKLFSCIFSANMSTLCQVFLYKLFHNTSVPKLTPGFYTDLYIS